MLFRSYAEYLHRLGDPAWKILCYLLWHIDGDARNYRDRELHTTMDRLVEETGKSWNTLKGCLRELQDAGCIEYRIGKHKGTATVIELKTPRHGSKGVSI